MREALPATSIPGDGIGPEIVDAVLAALNALGPQRAARNPFRRGISFLTSKSTTIRTRSRWPRASTPAKAAGACWKFAFEHAVAAGRKKVTIVRKANIMKAHRHVSRDRRGAGKGIANPTALFLAAAMMLEHCSLADLGLRLRTAVADTLNVDRVRTLDLGGKASSAEFTHALVKRIANVPDHLD